MSLFISWGEGDKVEVRGGAHPSGTQPSRSVPPSKNPPDLFINVCGRTGWKCFPVCSQACTSLEFKQDVFKTWRQSEKKQKKKTHSTDCWACAQSEVLFGFKAFARSFQLPILRRRMFCCFCPYSKKRTSFRWSCLSYWKSIFDY